MEINISCGFGTLGPLIDVGLVKDNKKTCKKLLKSPKEIVNDFLDEDCKVHEKLFAGSPEFQAMFKRSTDAAEGTETRELKD